MASTERQRRFGDLAIAPSKNGFSEQSRNEKDAAAFSRRSEMDQMHADMRLTEQLKEVWDD